MKGFFQKYFLGIFLSIFLVLTCVFFHPFFTKGQIPFPSNLLVALYSPWKYVPDAQYANGPPNKPIGFDNIRQIYPYKIINRDALLNGKIPLWNPYIFSGTPNLAAYDSAVLYPFNLLTIGLSPMTAWSILVFIQPVLAGFFMMLLLRKLKFSLPVQLYGSFVYAFSGWMIGYWEEVLVLEHTILWLPLSFLGSLLLWETNERTKGFTLLVLSLISSLLAGFFQTALYVLIVTVFWNIYLFYRNRAVKQSLQLFFYVMLAFFTAMLVTSVQWLPTLEAYRLTTRSTGDGIFLFQKYLLPLRHLITFLIPDFWGNPGTYNYFSNREGFYFEKVIFIGIVPFLFALYGLWKGKSQYVGFWKIATLISLSLGFAIPTSWIFYYAHVPVLSSALPTRIFGVFCFFVSLLSSYGFSQFIETNKTKAFKFLLIACTAVFIFIWIFLGIAFLVHRYTGSNAGMFTSGTGMGMLLAQAGLFMSQFQIRYSLYGTIALRNTVVPSVFLILAWCIYILKKRSLIFVYVFTGISLFFSSFYFASKIMYFSEPRFVFPDTAVLTKLKELSGYDRVWGYGNAYIEKNMLVPFHIYTPDGYGAIFSKYYGELLSGIKNEGQIANDIRRSDADLFEASEMEALGKGNPFRLRMMSVLGVKYILETKKGLYKEHKTMEDRFPNDLFSLSYEDEIWRIWEYRNALPRAFFVSRIEVVPDEEELMKKLYDPMVDLRYTVFVASTGGLDVQTADSDIDGSVKIEKYEQSEVVLSVEAPVKGALFISDTYYPGWEAYVDGKKVEIMKANYAFRLVPVPEGSHTVRFVYVPSSFRFGVGISIVGIFCFIFFWYRLRCQEEKI